MKHIYISGIILLTPLFSHAAPTDDLGTFAEWLVGDGFASFGLINTLIVWLISFGVLFFIYGGYQFATSGINQEKKEDAKRHMINSIIGIFVMISIWGFVNILISSIDFDDNTDVTTNPYIVAPLADVPT